MIALLNNARATDRIFTQGYGLICHVFGYIQCDACEATRGIAREDGRYDMTVRLNGLEERNIAVYAGSSEPLHDLVLAFSVHGKGYVSLLDTEPGSNGQSAIAAMRWKVVSPGRTWQIEPNVVGVRTSA